ncbi:MAG: Ig-like domain-containing protein [Bacteroidales bacterium]|nr:Ig-like domain-containing protein [Bacteroidales bacterium]
MKRLVLQFVLVLGMTVTSFGQVKLNEIQTSNSKTQMDPDFYKYKDWVELYNPSSSSVDLSGYYLTDNKDKPRKWQIPSGKSIPSKGYLLIYCDGEDVVGKAMHTNFKLSSGGDKLFLYSPTMFLEDSVKIASVETDYTYGRLTDGTGAWGLLSKPTPGAANVSTTVKGLAPKPVFSVQGGFYSKPQTVLLSSDLEGAVIRYTTDGTEPTEKSEIYTGAITAQKVSAQSLISGYDKKNKTNVQHYQWTDGDGQLSSPSVYDWGEVEKGFVLKAKVFHENYVPSVTACQTYFINMSRPGLPIVSVTVDKGSFFSADSGIYIQGTNGCKRGGTGDVKANWNQDSWERKVYVEYFDVNGTRQFGVNAGSSVMGAISRHSDLKSLNIKMKKKYEEGRMNYPIFGSDGLDYYESIILRNAGNDWEQGMFARDAVAQSIVRGQCDLETQAYQPVVMYLNGEYWSFINLRERYDKHYFGGHYDYVDEGKIDLLKINGDKDCFVASEGDSLRWEELMAYLKVNSMKDVDNYNYVKNHYVDVDNMINYYIAQLYSQNTDWPNNNMRLWRPRTENGKFRFPWYDVDFGYGLWGGSASTNPFSNFDKDKSYIAVKFFYYMMENDEFKSEFIQRFHYMINTVYDATRSKTIINDTENKISSERETSDSKWYRSESAKYSSYRASSLVSFAESRPAQMRTFLNSKFGSKGTAKLSVSYTDSQGTVQLCGLNVNSGYNGAQYKSTPIRLTAIPKDGYTFKYWQSGTTTVSTDMEYMLTITSDYSIKAVFESRSTEKNLYINEFLTANTTDILSPIGEHEDWVEIYNAGTTSVNLAGLYLSDDRTNLGKYQIPYTQLDSTFIDAKGFVVFYADKDSNEGALHLPFKMDKSGGVIILSQKSTNGTYTVLDSIHYEKQNADVSYGRYPDGTSTMTIFTKTTPRATNKIESDTYISGLVITELMAKNESVVKEETGTYADWFEIYNSTSNDIDLGGLFVTNDLTNPNMYMIPKGEPAKTTIKAGGYYVFWCDKQTAINPNHVDFKLNAEKGDIAIVQLRGSQNYFIDQVSYTNQGEDVAYGRYPKTTSDFTYLLTATPGSANKNSGSVTKVSGVTINEILALNTSIVDETGAYSDYIEFYNGTNSAIDLGGLFISDSKDYSLRYKIPTTNSKLTTVQAGKWLVFWADGKPELGENHLDFSLDGQLGEDVVLSQVTEDGLTVIDEISFAEQTANVSYGRYPETYDNWETMSPTNGAKNQSFNSSVALKTLTSSVGTILPAVSTSILEYECAVPAGTTEIPVIEATTVHEKAKVTITQPTSLDDIAVVKVISANGYNSETYKVSFKIAASDDATLASLVSAGGTMAPAFSPDTYKYVVTLSTTYVPYVTAKPSNENAMVKIDYAETASESTIITVTAEDGFTQDYELTYILASSQNVVTEWFDDFSKGIGNLSAYTSQYIIQEHESSVGFAKEKDAAIALDEKDSDAEYGYVEYHLPTGYVLDGSSALNVSMDMNIPDEGSKLNGVTVTNQYMSFAVALVDMYGNVSNYMIVDAKVNETTSVSINFGTASYITKSAIVAVRFGLYGPNDKKKARQKGVIIDNLVIGPKTATGVSETVVLSSNADLTTLTASAGTLSPVFSKTTKSYILTLPAETEELPTISATVADKTAFLEIAQAADLQGVAYVKVISQDMSVVNEYEIVLNLEPLVVEGFTDCIIQPAMKGWNESSNMYELTYNGGDISVEYNRTTSSSDAISYNVTESSVKILDLTKNPYASIKMKTTVNTKLFVELFDSKGNKTSASLEAVNCVAGNDMVTYIFDFTDKFVSVDVADIRGMNIYFDKGSATKTNGTIKIDEIRFGKDVEVTVNQAPEWSEVAEQIIQQGEEFSNINLSTYVKDDLSEFENLLLNIENKFEHLDVSIEGGFLKVSPKSSEWIGSEIVKVSATDESGESSSVSIKYTVEELKVDVTEISFKQKSVELAMGKTVNVLNLLEYKPVDATIESIEWSVSDKSVASVSGVGVLTNLLEFGSEEITVTVTVLDKSGNSFEETISAVLTGCPTRISLVKPEYESVTLYYGEKLQIGYSLYPEDACEKSVAYASDDPTVATVSSNGVVTASKTKKGTATITISVNDGFSVKTAECEVSVSKDCSGDIELSLNKSSLALLEGGKATLTATITPEDECTEDKEIVWSSSNSKVTVDQKGVVTAVEEGSAVITAQTTGNGKTAATCVVTVSRDCKSGAVDVVMNSEKESMYLTDELILTAEITTGNPCNENIVWSSSDETVAKVSEGVVVPLKYGKTIIRATAEQDEDSYAECEVSVVEKVVEKVTVKASASRMYVEASQKVSATLTPDDAEDQTIEWSSSDETIATVTQKGIVTALSEGAVRIIATAASKVSGYCEIQVLPVLATAIQVTPSSVILSEHDVQTISVTFVPENTTNKELSWKSFDESVATVEDGVITAVGEGTTSITVTTSNGITEVISVEVTAEVIPVSSVSIESSISMKIGEKSVLEATVLPDNATNKTVSWKSSDTKVAEVATNGTVTAVGVGNAIITATSVNGKTAESNVEVTYREISNVEFSETEIALSLGKSFDLSEILVLNPEKTEVKSIEWSVNSTDASVSKDGILTNNLDYGTKDVVVTAGITDMKKKKKTATVTVTLTGCANKIQTVKLNQTAVDITLNETSQISVSTTPLNACVEYVKYVSDDDLIVTVSGTGKVTPKTEGETTINVIISDGYSTIEKVIPVVISKEIVAVESVKFEETTLTKHVNDKFQLVAIVTPENATNKTLEWTSSDEKIATVDEEGFVTVKAEGNVTIVATANNKKTASCLIKVSEIPVSSLDLSKTNVTITINSTVELSAEVNEDATNKTVIWTSSNEDVATVDENGVITAKGVGSCTVKASAGTISKTCVVTVAHIQPESLSLSSSSVTVDIDKSEKVIAEWTPKNATDTIITWTSENENIAVVSNGVITGVAAGNTVVSAKIGAKKITKEVSVLVNPMKAESIQLNAVTTVLLVNQQQTLIATILPEKTTDKTITWTSSNPSLVSVDKTGKITANALTGEDDVVVITATTENGLTATCEVSVTKNVVAVTNVTIKPATVTLSVGGYQTVVAEILPTNASNKSLSWESDNKQVATVDQYGKITAKSVGNAIVTAKTTDGIYGSCNVNVKEIEVEAIAINDISLAIGESLVLTATVSPTNATGASLVWEVEDNTVATINSTSGKIVGVAEGSTKVSATAANGVKGEAVVTVASTAVAVSSIYSSGTTTINIGDKLDMTEKIKFSPANATNRALRWDIVENTPKYEDESVAVATLNGGVLTAKVAGTVKLRAVSLSNPNATTTVTVTVNEVYANEIILSNKELEIVAGNQETLTATVLPYGASCKTVTWSSSNPNVAYISASGVITAYETGTATISARSSAKSSVYAACTVKVIDQPISEIVAETDTLRFTTLGAMLPIVITVNPFDAETKALKWVSSNESVVKIEKMKNTQYIVTAESYGKAEVTITASSGVECKVVCVVAEPEKKNTAPVVTSIPDQKLEAGKTLSIDLNEYYFDLEGDAISWNIDKMNSNINCVISSSGIATFSVADEYGTDGMQQIAVYAKDSKGNEAQTNLIMFTITTKKKQDVDPSAVESLNTLNLVVAPVPTNGPITISFETESPEDCLIEIYSVVGRKIYSTTTSVFGEYSMEYDLTGNVKGGYIVKVTIGKEQKIVKLVLK